MQRPKQAGSRIARRTCPLCEANCSLNIEVLPDGGIGRIEGDADDPWSKGYICPKGTALGYLHFDPDRLRQPMVRDRGQLRAASWDEAYATCEERIHWVLKQHGIGAFTAYLGNPVAHVEALSRYFPAIGNLLPSIYSGATVDTQAKNVVCTLMYGNPWLIPVPDIHRSGYFLCLGANPAASNGSLWTCPDVMGEIRKVRERGGKVVVVDPRRTGTAIKADEWIAIQPGTDAAFLLAMANVMFSEHLVDLGAVADQLDGLPAVRVACEAFTPENTEAFTRVPAATTRRIARELAAAEAPCVYGRIGLCNQEFGMLASWMVEILAICSGGFDRPGGLMFGNPMATTGVWLQSTRDTGIPVFGKWHSRATHVPEVLDQLPVGCLAEEILTPGERQVRGLFLLAANPVIAAPDSRRLERALGQLDCMISLDNYLNETSSHAHVILPGHSALEHSHFDNSYGAWSVRSFLRWSDAVLSRDPKHPEEWESLLRLQGLLRGQRNEDIDIEALDDELFEMYCHITGTSPATAKAMSKGRGIERLVDWAIRTGPIGDLYGARPGGWTLDRVRQDKRTIDFGALIPRAKEAVCTPNGRIDLAPAFILADLDRLKGRMDDSRPATVLIGRRDVRSNNSWLHNVPALVKGRNRCTLIMHPDDAEKYGIADGALATLSNDTGRITMSVQISNDILPGVVCLPHGWGHDSAGSRLKVAETVAGVNSNIVAPAGFLDRSGNHALNGIPVEITAA